MSVSNARLVTSKTCFRCKGIKSTKDFPKDNSKKDSLSIYCSTCIRSINKARRSDTTYNAKRRAESPRYARQNRAWRLRTKYGISIEDFEQMFESQGKVCALCKSDKSDSNQFVMDHCHATGRIRGILCSYCNRALGMFKDSVDILNKAIVYLSK